MKSKVTKKAVSLVEILVSAVLLSLVVGGLVAAFLSVSSYIRHAKERSTATDLSYSHFKTLHQDVRADSWNTGNLSDGTNQSLPLTAGEWMNIDGINYEGPNTKYEVDDVTSQDYREVEVTVEYPD
ncbi:MAG: hypothetical protein K9L71_03790 [Candidatus Omnitrophica bacterium]|nr:hypothetical protein [Candidatus Omnitrophota bacterium]